DWNLVLFHCAATCHQHPITSWQNVASGSFVAPDHEYPSYLELTASVTDSGGATTTAVRRIDPRTVDLTFTTDPVGLGLTIGGSEQAARTLTPTRHAGSRDAS